MGEPVAGHDPKMLRACLGHFATGVTIVTAEDHQGRPHGVTVNSFTSVSLEPALVLISIARSARACAVLREKGFVVNVLHRQQSALAWHFAGRADDELPLPWIDIGGQPALDGCVAHIACAPYAAYDGGDHVLFLGEVESFVDHGGEPLLFHLGKFRLMGALLD